MMVFAMLMLILLVAVLIGLDAVGDLFLPARLLIALLVVVVTGWLCWRWHARRVVVRLSISGIGQIHLQQPADSAKQQMDEGPAELVTLLPSSTIWPWLLILHLQNVHGRTAVILILRDSVSQETFNALLVACRWLAMRRPENELPEMRRN